MQQAEAHPAGAQRHRDGEEEKERSAPEVDRRGVGIASSHVSDKGDVVTDMATDESLQTISSTSIARRDPGVAHGRDTTDKAEGGSDGGQDTSRRIHGCRRLRLRRRAANDQSCQPDQRAKGDKEQQPNAHLPVLGK